VAVAAMTSQPAFSLTGFELPIEEFVDQKINNVNSSNNPQTVSAEISGGTWRRTDTLGRGSYGHVWLQERDMNVPAPHARAVKEVALSQLRKDGIDPLNEISAMARFSKPKVDQVFKNPDAFD
jgi:hypothetical protein